MTLTGRSKIQVQGDSCTLATEISQLLSEVSLDSESIDSV